MPNKIEIEKNFERENKKIKKFLKYKDAVIGKIDGYTGFYRLEERFPIGNFGADFILKQPDEKLEKQLIGYNNAPFKKIGTLRRINNILKRIDEIGGMLSHWI